MLLLVASLIAQEPSGAILGHVVDPTGAVIPNASVKITNVATGVTAAVVTNERGNYLAPYPIPGTYRIEAEAAGFKRVVQNGIELRVNDRLEVNLTLEVGPVTEQVTVVAETPLLETATASMGSVVDARRVAELPFLHGNPYHLIQLAVGVAFAQNLTLDRPFEPTHIVGYTMDGARSNRSDIMLDSSVNSASGNTGTRNELIPSWVPPADLGAEFKVQTAPSDATVGQTEGGVVNVSLKSGTNASHGTAYYVKMAPELTANLFFSNRNNIPRSNFTYNRWGATAGGPVYLPRYDGRNRTFFMYGYEGIREERPRGSTLTVTTEKQRQGDFSDLLRLGAQYQIYDPATRRPAGAGDPGNDHPNGSQGRSRGWDAIEASCHFDLDLADRGLPVILHDWRMPVCQELALTGNYRDRELGAAKVHGENDGQRIGTRRHRRPRQEALPRAGYSLAAPARGRFRVMFRLSCKNTRQPRQSRTRFPRGVEWRYDSMLHNA